MADETNEIMENEATVLQFAAASNLSLADILYLIQGTGTDRDKKMTLEQLRDFLQELFSKIKVIGVGGNAELTNALLKLKNGTSETKVNTDGLEVNSGTEKAFFKVGSFGFESDDGANGQVDYDASSHSWVFNIACQFDEGITVYGDASVSGTVTANSVTATNGTFTNLLGETKFNTLKNGTKVQTRTLEATTATTDNVTSERVCSAKYVDTGIVALDTTSLANKSWQLMTNWEVGQVKHIYDPRETGTSTEITAYKSTAGTIGTLTFTLKANYFFTAVCIGTITVEGTEYAQLIINNG